MIDFRVEGLTVFVTVEAVNGGTFVEELNLDEALALAEELKQEIESSVGIESGRQRPVYAPLKRGEGVI